MEKDLIQEISKLCGENSSKVVNTLYSEGLLNNNSIRNYLIRKEFDRAIRQDNSELIKNIFMDISEKYEISVRQAQRVVYDYMSNKTVNKCQEY